MPLWNARPHRESDQARGVGDEAGQAVKLMQTNHDMISCAAVSVERRRFLKGVGALVVTFCLDRSGLADDAQGPELDAWLSVDGTGRVTLLSGKVELGQGIVTAFAQIAAEELDVPFDSIMVVQGDTSKTPDQGITSASRSIATGGPQIRQAAAEARRALLERASKHLGVSIDELKVTDGVISDGTAKVSYAELIGDKTFNRRIDGKAPVKPHANYKIVGKPIARIDIPEKVTGRFTYVQDVRLPGMLHGRVVRPPSIGASLIEVHGFSRNRPDVQIVRKKDFLAVVAPTEWEAIEAAADLKATWSPGPALQTSDDLAATLRAMPTADAVTKISGKLDDGFVAATRIVSATYLWPFQSHGSIGPSCAVADVRQDGTATIWSATQDIYMQREAVARLLKIPTGNVRIIYVEGSGCYGHNGSDDANGDAALLSQEVGRPVRVQWMRHDEHAWAPRGAPLLVDLRAGLNAAGAVTAWDFQSWALTHSGRYRHYGKRVSGYLLASQLSGREIDVPLVVESGRIINTAAISGTSPNYNFPHARTLVHGLPTTEPHPLRPTEFRSVSALAAVFAVESFIDELAVAGGQDPLQFRISHLQDPRSIRALQEVARLSDWQPRSASKSRDHNGRLLSGRGVAQASYNTYVAAVADVDVDSASGEIHVRRIYMAHDCGMIVNPDGLRSQIEGNLIQAASRSLLEEVKWDSAKVTSVDWSTYPILKFPAIPELRISLIDNPDTASSGAGEAATMPVGAAIANAVFDAVGARLRRGPFTPTRVKAAMA
jgi:nicotinate dehydrogenase subunit B